MTAVAARPRAIALAALLLAHQRDPPEDRSLE